MDSCYVVGIALACFGLGVGFGMAVPFFFIALYNGMSKVFEIGDIDLGSEE